MKEDIILEAKELSVVLGGHQVLQIPFLAVSSGEVLAVIGPNGAGKTTLLLSLALLLKLDKGKILYQGKEITDGERLRLRRKFAVVFQEPLLLSGSVWENVTLGMRLRGVEKETIRARADRWLESFDIAHLAKRQAKRLSGGEAKRVSLAQAFALQPEILFLDEPFVGLDTPTHQAIIDDFSRVLQREKVTTVMVMHDHDEVLALASRVAVMLNGSIRQVSSAQTVFSSPVDEEVASFIRAGNILFGTVISQNNGLAQVKVNEQLIEAVTDLACGTPVIIYLSYDAVTISVAARQPSSARNYFSGKIKRIMTNGQLAKIEIDCGFPLIAMVTRISVQELEMAQGKSVNASFKSTAIHLIKR